MKPPKEERYLLYESIMDIIDSENSGLSAEDRLQEIVEYLKSIFD